jgi:hypothetical protein
MISCAELGGSSPAPFTEKFKRTRPFGTREGAARPKVQRLCHPPTASSPTAGTGYSCCAKACIYSDWVTLDGR